MTTSRHLAKAFRWLAMPGLTALGAGVGILVYVLGSTGEQPRGRIQRRERTPEEASAIQADTAPLEQPTPLRRQVQNAAFERRSTTSAFEQESMLLQELRRLALSDPERSVALTQDFDERFPEGPRDPERAWYQARTLVDLGRFNEARRIARETVQRNPDDSWSRDLERHLLSHPFGLPPRDH